MLLKWQQQHSLNIAVSLLSNKGKVKLIDAYKVRRSGKDTEDYCSNWKDVETFEKDNDKWTWGQ